MQDCIEKLSNANKILYNNIDLYYYAKFYETYFNDTFFRVYFDNSSIDIICLERHFPHLIGLHHFRDINSKCKLMRKPKELERNRGFDNIINRQIVMRDLQNSRGGKVWSNRKNKKRVLCVHLLRKLLYNSKIYLVDGNIKGKVNAKYIFVSQIEKDVFNICVDEDIEYDRLDKSFCCISNLIENDSRIGLYTDGCKELKVKRIEQRDLYTNRILNIHSKEYNIDINNTNVLTKNVPLDCISELLAADKCYFNATLNSVDSSYIISYFYFDKKVSQIVNRYIA